MQKRSFGLLFRFATVFLVFLVVTLFFSGLANYSALTRSYKQECRNNARNVGEYLESLILLEGQDFLNYHNYFMKNFRTATVPFDFDEYKTAQADFVDLFSKYFPDKKARDVNYDDYPEEIKKAHFRYKHEYWTLVFEKARKDFELPYTYFITPVMDTHSNDGSYFIYYVIDGERTVKAGSVGHFLNLGDSYYHKKGQVKVEWKVWSTGKKCDEFQEWNNSYGHTYTYYIPLIIEGQKIGLIGTDIDVSNINRTILFNTLIQTIRIGGVLVICTLLVLLFINVRYIKRIKRLSRNVQDYSQTKNVSIVKKIERDAEGGEELSFLAKQTSAMILEIDNFTQTLLDANAELSKTKAHADTLRKLATCDALTGVRNKTAYDEEIRKIDESIGDGFIQFGIVMIDMNFLKHINDTYGHEHGNLAIKKICRIACIVFEHSPVFRIGGDEFVVILQGLDFENIENLENEFYRRIKECTEDESLEQWERVSAAMGYALFDEEKDTSAASVFKRADKAMYANKKQMKAVRV